MSNYNDVRRALAASIKAEQPDLNVFPYMPRTFTPPAAIVKPASNRTISYLQAQSSSLAEWHFSVLMVVGLVDEDAAQTICGNLISPGSNLIRALNNTKLPTGYAQVVHGSVSEMPVPGGPGGAAVYTHAELYVIAFA